MKGYIIEAFAAYFEAAENKGAILEFVRRQRKSASPRIREKAGQFLSQWDKEQP